MNIADIGIRDLYEGIGAIIGRAYRAKVSQEVTSSIGWRSFSNAVSVAPHSRLSFSNNAKENENTERSVRCRGPS